MKMKMAQLVIGSSSSSMSVEREECDNSDHPDPSFVGWVEVGVGWCNIIISKI